MNTKKQLTSFDQLPATHDKAKAMEYLNNCRKMFEVFETGLLDMCRQLVTYVEAGLLRREDVNEKLRNWIDYDTIRQVASGVLLPNFAFLGFPVRRRLIAAGPTVQETIVARRGVEVVKKTCVGTRNVTVPITGINAGIIDVALDGQRFKTVEEQKAALNFDDKVTQIVMTTNQISRRFMVRKNKDGRRVLVYKSSPNIEMIIGEEYVRMWIKAFDRP
jgi:hypothetical protein